MDFADWDNFEQHHYAFYINEETFDDIFGRIKAEGISYGSDPSSQDNMEINTRRPGRTVYFQDSNRHSYEIFTQKGAPPPIGT